MRKIVVLGCGVAGWSAAVAARKTDREAHITVIEQDKNPMYERGGIPYVINGDIPNFDALINLSNEYYDFMKIDLRLETKANKIDPSKKEVIVVDKNGIELRVNYDNLILATGADPFIVPVPGYNLPEVYTVRTLDDGRKIFSKCKVAKKVVVVGARLVGLETAVALKNRGMDVTVIELIPQILDGVLDSELAHMVQEKLEKLGLRFILGSGISQINGEDCVEAVRAGHHEVKADMVVMATGVRGRTELAQQIGVELGETRLIKVDERMETNVKGVFAAGDCIECISAITNKPITSQLGGNAIRHGKVAGTNAAGGSIKFPNKILGSCISKILDTEIASTGLTEAYAKKLGIDCVSAYAKSPGRPPCYPDKLPIQIKLVANINNGKLIGAQILSRGEAGPRIDMISLAIMAGIHVEDIIFFDHAFTPPLADSNDPLSTVAEILNRKLN